MAELDCVFTMRFPDDGPVDTWVVSKYDPPRCIEFVRINPLRSIRYCITLTPEPDGTTRAVWSQVATGLNPEGNALVDSLTDSAFQQEIAMLQNMLDHFMETGEMLKIMGSRGPTGSA